MAMVDTITCSPIKFFHRIRMVSNENMLQIKATLDRKRTQRIRFGLK
jgi:hypothetical protein